MFRLRRRYHLTMTDPLDQEICACFHVPLRKLWHYARREKLQHYSQITNCLGAGTGCGSCEALLAAIAELAPTGDLDALAHRLEGLIAQRDTLRVDRLARRRQSE